MTRGGRNPEYSAVEDDLILAAKRGEYAALAERLGRPYKAVMARRRELLVRRGVKLSNRRMGSPRRTTVKMESPALHRIGPALARPVWFVEEINPRAGR